MKRLVAPVVLATVATVAIALTGTTALAPPTGATGTSGAKICDLVTKKEAKKILGAKIVDVTPYVDPSTGADACEWTSARFSDKSFKKSDSRYSLSVSVQPVTPEVRAELDQKEDLQPIAGLGDEAYLDGADAIVIQGDDVLVAETHNWAGRITARRTDRVERAARLALGRLPQG